MLFSVRNGGFAVFRYVQFKCVLYAAKYKIVCKTRPKNDYPSNVIIMLYDSYYKATFVEIVSGPRDSIYYYIGAGGAKRNICDRIEFPICLSITKDIEN